MKKVKLEYQYFEGCPNHHEMLGNIREALLGLEDIIELEFKLIDTGEKAQAARFRGSPTLLINGEDIEGMPAPPLPMLSCRYYAGGLPRADEIRRKIKAAGK